MGSLTDSWSGPIVVVWPSGGWQVSDAYMIVAGMEVRSCVKVWMRRKHGVEMRTKKR